MQAVIDRVRTGRTPAELKQAILDNLYYVQCRIPDLATTNDWYMAVAYAVRDRMMNDWIQAFGRARKTRIRIVSYLSAEFLIGPQLGSNLLNVYDIRDAVEAALADLGQSLDKLLAHEPEPGLGNGGLGRLAACYMESLTTLDMAAIGYGIRYEFGLFDQEIQNGWQVEKTDKWLSLGNPWETTRPEIAHYVGTGGHTEQYHDEPGHFRVRWIPEYLVRGIANDIPVAGYLTNMTNFLRLWSSEAVESFDFQAFNKGDYYDAVQEKVASETISKVLYPNDEAVAGKVLRLQQQYFFTSCSLQDMIRIHKLRGLSLHTFHETYAIQLNDTHPSIAVAELMRLLIDIHEIDWDEAWSITQKALAYTNHTLLPEALEKWPLPLFASLLPRHLEIIYEINRHFLDEVRAKRPSDDALLSRVSLIDEHDQKYVRMANLATVGSHAVNGVAALHTELLKKTVLHDFYELFPDKFFNITNGVTPRRWLALSNPELSHLISTKIGDNWLKHEEELRKLEPLADDADFRARWRQVKYSRKQQLVALIHERTGMTVSPDTMFDVQVKRIHEYKRQLLNLLYVITLYNRIKHDPHAQITPRTVIFGGKAAPGYFMAKLIIKLINSVASTIDADGTVRDRLRVVFIPDFNVKSGQVIYPAAELSEQISTAGKEASGTGNMKFSMNGALTIGTLDGANVEIREEVGDENFFLFGLTADQVVELKRSGYNPRHYYDSNPVLKEVIDQIADGTFSAGDQQLFRPIVDSLLNSDEYLLLADFQSYLDCQEAVSHAYRDQEHWTRMSILNTARMGKFSSDRSIREYARDIWHVEPLNLAAQAANAGVPA
jgi:glycogen phosphorylase